MKYVSKLLILLGFATLVTGCVVAPYGPRPRVYLAVPAPVIVVHPAYYYGPRW